MESLKNLVKRELKEAGLNGVIESLRDTFFIEVETEKVDISIFSDVDVVVCGKNEKRISIVKEYKNSIGEVIKEECLYCVTEVGAVQELISTLLLIYKVGEEVTVKLNGIEEPVNATIEGFKTLPSGKELVIITTENGNRFPVEKKQVKENIIKASGKITIEKYEDVNMWEEVENRYLNYYITLTTKNGSKKNLESLYDKVVNFMENKDSDIKFNRCPTEEEEQDKIYYTDGFLIPYEYGNMKDIKEYIRDIWKETKKEFNIN